MKVEFIYDLNCPNIAATRANLMKALSEAGLPAKWIEWDRNSSNSPDYAKQYGSPTILVNGKDIVDNMPTKDNHCRIYQDENLGIIKTPSVSLIMEELKKGGHQPNGSRFTWQNVLSVLPSIFVAMLPKLTCPLCWPLYTGILSSFGIAFVNYTAYLLPLTIFFLLISLVTFGYKAKRRRGYYPLALGIVASLIIVVGKFGFNHDWALYAGVILLVIASLWNGWPVTKSKPCSKCK